MKRTIFFACFLILIFNGCMSKQVKSANPAPISKEFKQMLSQLPTNTLTAKYIHQGIGYIEEKNYSSASKTFQEGLRFYPEQSSLHFLNALTYHLQSFKGNSQTLELAKSGYLTALKFDPKNYWAAYFLGHIYFEQKLYEHAQNYFSYTLLYVPKSPLFLRALATASYYANDPTMSLWSAEQAYTLEPQSLNGLQALIFAHAASGNFKEASNYYKKFEETAPLKEKKELHVFLQTGIKDRLQNWQVYHTSSDESIYGDKKDFEDTFIQKGIFADTSYNPALDNAKSNSRISTDSNQTLATKQNDRTLPRMVLVDVVIIGTEEVRSQSKGINLLEGLTTTLSGTLYEYNYVKGGDKPGKQVTFNPSFNFMALEYNLNIFNDANNKAEVLAKPSLLATENQPSKFYSGAVLHVQLASNFSDGTVEDVPIGIHLEVTPSFYGEDIVGLSIHAERGFLQSLSEKVGFTSFSQTSTVSVDATAILKLGETLVLSGLSEVENTKTKSGVPFLQSIPLIQYLFSRDEESQVKKSILILLTPRDAKYMDEEFAKNNTSEALNTNMKEQTQQFTRTLKQEHKIKNPSNIETILAYLEDSRFYRQFLAGDVKIDRWDDIDTLENALKRSLEFLYY